MAMIHAYSNVFKIRLAKTAGAMFASSGRLPHEEDYTKITFSF